MRTPLLLCLALLASALGPGLPARGANPPAAEARVDFEVDNVPLSDALTKLFKGTPYHFTIADDIPPIRVRLRARDVTLKQAARLLVRLAQVTAPYLDYRWDGDTLRLSRSEAPHGLTVPVTMKGPADPRLRGAVTIDYVRVPLHDALARLLGPAGVGVSIDEEVRDLTVTVKLANVSRFEAMNQIVEAAQRRVPAVRLARNGDLYGVEVVWPRPPDAWKPTLRDTMVTASFRQVPLQVVLKAFLSGFDLPYAVAPKVKALEVGLEVRNVTLEGALRWLIETPEARAGKLHYHFDGDVLVFDTRTPDEEIYPLVTAQ